MAAQMLGRLLCLVRKHEWRVEFNRETQGTEAECLRCEAHKSTYPGDPSLGRGQPGAGGTATWGGGSYMGEGGPGEGS